MSNNSVEASVVVLIDFINDIVSEGGKLAGKGYLDYVIKHGVGQKVADLTSKARAANIPIIHVRVGFSKGYIDHPSGSPLFGGAKNFEALALGTWGTEFAEYAMPNPDELVVNKHRVSAFYGTDLDVALRVLSAKTLYIAGCATDLAVQAACRDAHDRDFDTIIVEDACAAANDEDHTTSLGVLGKIAKVSTVEEVSF